MSGTAPQQAERAELCALFLLKGPDAPTLCEGWNAVDLAAHLVVREHDPVSAAGIVLGGALGRRHDRAIARMAADTPFPAIVERVRSGPPLWWRPIDPLANLMEYFVHHEDLRRGGGDTTPRPEADAAPVEAALTRMLRRAAPFLTRGAKGMALDLVVTGQAPIRARKGPGDPVTVEGRAGEIVLYLSGRRAAAHVDIGGPPDQIERLQKADLGL